MFNEVTFSKALWSILTFDTCRVGTLSVGPGGTRMSDPEVTLSGGRSERSSYHQQGPGEEDQYAGEVSVSALVSIAAFFCFLRFVSVVYLLINQPFKTQTRFNTEIFLFANLIKEIKVFIM